MSPECPTDVCREVAGHSPPLRDVSNLSGVACPNTTTCTAVGYYKTSSGDATLVEHWNGTNWSIVTSPDPSGSIILSLNDVACPSTTRCTAVGHYQTSSGDATLVEHWNGTHRSIVASPNPAIATDSNLSGLECRSPTSCTAVGDYRAHASD